MKAIAVFSAMMAVLCFGAVAQASSYGVDFNGVYMGNVTASGTCVWPDPAGALAQLPQLKRF